MGEERGTDVRWLRITTTRDGFGWDGLRLAALASMVSGLGLHDDAMLLFDDGEASEEIFMHTVTGESSI